MTIRPTTFSFVRHGETAFNVTGQFRGRADPPLTVKGEAQAKAVGFTLATTMPVGIYTSPRLRAETTAEQIARRAGLRVRVEPSLDDVDYGKWTGMTTDRARDESPALFADWLSRPERVRFPDGEAVEHLVSRVDNLISSLSARHEGAHVILVTHDVLIRLWVCQVLSAPLASMHRIRIDLTSVSVFERRGEAVVMGKVNDTSHLVPSTIDPSETRGGPP